jgi:hypothetical protein
LFTLPESAGEYLLGEEFLGQLPVVDHHQRVGASVQASYNVLCVKENQSNSIKKYKSTV